MSTGDPSVELRRPLLVAHPWLGSVVSVAANASGKMCLWLYKLLRETLLASASAKVSAVSI